MDYYEIGQRIRKARKAHRLSQEELAAKIDISTTHMSHIETGNTKLSLPVLVDLAVALDVNCDELLFGSRNQTLDDLNSELCQAVEGCSPQQMKVILDTVKAVRFSLTQNYE